MCGAGHRRGSLVGERATARSPPPAAAPARDRRPSLARPPPPPASQAHNRRPACTPPPVEVTTNHPARRSLSRRARLRPAVRREGAPGALPTRASRANICRHRNIQREADMTPRIPENIRTLFAGWSLVTIVGDVPPRDPDDDDDDAAEDEDEEEDDEPAVIREPNEDE